MSRIRVAIALASLAGCTKAMPAAATDAAPVADASPDASPDAAPSATHQLAIPPRQQWPNAGGYCGETSIQAIGLYYGAWISQKVVRAVAGGELLIGVNDDTALSTLHLRHLAWSSNAPAPQFTSFMTWMKDHLEHDVPVVYGIYLTDGINDPDYDHIVPATGITATALTGYDATDVLTASDNFDDRITRAFGTLEATRATCASSTVQGGCVPQDVDYGVAITGLEDAQQVTLPATLTVTVDPEPNVSTGEKAVQMTGTVTVRGLVAGHTYALLRYDDYTQVPGDGTAADFLASSYTHRTNFTATAATWTLVDPDTFLSSGTAYYRCVPAP